MPVVRRVYCSFVHSTNNISSTLYEWQARTPTTDRRGHRTRRRPGRGAGRRAGASRELVGGEGRREAYASKAARSHDTDLPRRPRRRRRGDRAREPSTSARSTSGRGIEPGARRPRFTRDEIAAAAMRIADAEGFDAVSMRRLAAELDAGTMTLYHYVRTKDELLTLVRRRGHGRGRARPPTSRCPTDWRDAITMIAERSRAALRASSVDPRHRRRSRRSARTACATSTSRCRPSRRCRSRLAEKIDIVTAVDEYVFGYCLHRAQQPHDRTSRSFDDDMVAYVNGLVADAATTRSSRRSPREVRPRGRAGARSTSTCATRSASTATSPACSTASRPRSDA